MPTEIITLLHPRSGRIRKDCSNAFLLRTARTTAHGQPRIVTRLFWVAWGRTDHFAGDADESAARPMSPGCLFHTSVSDTRKLLIENV